MVSFGHRSLGFGEGPLVHSPADVATLVGVQSPSEDDVLHADRLPTFSETLSREEAESLLAYLTVDYVRIPLVVGFFATSDRITYLFNRELQVPVCPCL
jgi:hypothetical protein